jgi:hypothetical protein
MDTAALLEQLSPQVRKICAPDTPAQLKNMAAAGLAPLPPADMVSALAILSADPARDIADKARGTLAGMPENVLLGTIDQQLHPSVLGLLAGLLVGRDAALQKLILTPGLPDEAVVHMARELRSERLLEVVTANEQRMLRCPGIIEALYFNKAVRMSTVDRIIELAVRHGIELSGIPAFAEVKAAIAGRQEAPAGKDPTPEDLFFSDLLDDADLAALDAEFVDEFLDSRAAGQDSSGDHAQKIAAANTDIGKMSVSHKVRLAMLGNATQRAVLIRDSNKMVILAVLKSPGLGDNEVMRFTKARSLPEEALRFICGKRDWTKHYQVKLNLSMNPRTPLQEALKYLNHLRPSDLRSLERSRDVPQAIARAAKNLREKRSH